MSVGEVRSGGAVEQAIRRAAQATGVDFDFLLKTAKRESGLNPQAKAPTSSAAGLFQFIEQTWLAVVKRHGAKHGYGEVAERIRTGPDGRLRVDDAARRSVMALRYDPKAASIMAAELASDHASYLRGRIGREPTAGELYAAHFLGPAGAAQLIDATERRPGSSAAALFPAAAGANPTIFRKAGRTVSVAELYAGLTRTGGGAPAITRAAEPVASPTPEPYLAYAGSARLDALSRERSLVEALLGQGGAGASAFGAQLLGAFVDRSDRS
jgi:hypothetical protein